ncbi:MAG: CBS domain-containing protein [Spirulinaceae cyanobacterium]
MSKTVADVMTPDPITVKPETSLGEAIKILAEKRISGLLVVDEEDKLLGILSETDLMWQESGVDPPPYITFLDSIIYLKNPARYDKDIHKALGQTAGEVMSEKPITIEATQALREAAKLMHEEKVRRLPVVNDAKQLVGIITQGDIIRSMAAS